MNNFSNQQEHALWLSFLEGNEDAFESLMTSHFRILYHYGLKFSSDQAFIKDSIQDLFLYLWEHRTFLSQQVSIKPYLMASLRRRINRSITRNSKMISQPDFDGETDFDVEFSVEESFIERESNNNLSEQVKRMLDSLAPRQKEVVYLRFFQNLNREEIAEVMDIAPQTVSNILQMAFKNIKTHWKVEYILSCCNTKINVPF